MDTDVDGMKTNTVVPLVKNNYLKNYEVNTEVYMDTVLYPKNSLKAMLLVIDLRIV